MVVVVGVLAAGLGVASLLIEGGGEGFIGGFLVLMIQLPTLALALLGASIFAPFEVSFLGFGASGNIVDAADEHLWLWLLPVASLAVGALGAGWMLLRRADASRGREPISSRSSGSRRFSGSSALRSCPSRSRQSWRL